MKANDADEGINSRIKYSITGGIKKEHFNIDADTGFITTATKLDYEDKQSYLLTVTGIYALLQVSKSRRIYIFLMKLN